MVHRRTGHLRKKSIARQISRTLEDAFEKPEEIMSVQQGVLSECPWCEGGPATCTHRPRRYCRRVYRAGTLLEEYEMSLDRLGDETFGRCVRCGGAIAETILMKFPMASLCSGCRADTVRAAARRSRGTSGT